MNVNPAPISMVVSHDTAFEHAFLSKLHNLTAEDLEYTLSQDTTPYFYGIIPFEDDKPYMTQHGGCAALGSVQKMPGSAKLAQVSSSDNFGKSLLDIATCLEAERRHYSEYPSRFVRNEFYSPDLGFAIQAASRGNACYDVSVVVYDAKRSCAISAYCDVSSLRAPQATLYANAGITTFFGYTSEDTRQFENFVANPDCLFLPDGFFDTNSGIMKLDEFLDTALAKEDGLHLAALGFISRPKLVRSIVSKGVTGEVKQDVYSFGRAFHGLTGLNSRRIRFQEKLKERF